jgi:hypothetical protein
MAQAMQALWFSLGLVFRPQPKLKAKAQSEKWISPQLG